MCGRFTLRTPHTKLLEQFGAADSSARPRYNILPTQLICIVGTDRKLMTMQWGFQGPVINARAETAADKPMFRDAFRHRRCLIPADGVIEWEKVGGKKLPYLIEMQDGQPFAFAGLWEDDRAVILTTDPNELIEPYHDRMAVILDPADYDKWLNDKTPLDELKSLCRTYPADRMKSTPVNTRVNGREFDDPACLEPRKPERLLF